MLSKEMKSKGSARAPSRGKAPALILVLSLCTEWASCALSDGLQYVGKASFIASKLFQSSI